MKLRTALVGAAFMATTLVGCGGGGAYCDSLTQADKVFGKIGKGDVKGMDQAFDRLQELADEAPSEVADDWKIVDKAIGQVRTALDDAGVSFEELANIKPGELPEGLTQDKLAALAADMQAMGTAEFSEATANIEAHAKEKCDIDLTESS